MRSRNIIFLTGLICLFIVVTGCATTPLPISPIVNPQIIDQKEAKSKLMDKYAAHIGTDFYLSEFARARVLCRDIADRKRTLEGVKSSNNGRVVVMLYSSTGLIFNTYGFINFTFLENASIYKKCSRSGCTVWVRNGYVRFGSFAKPQLDNMSLGNDGMQVNEIVAEGLRSEALFGYENENKKEGEELISLFLSAFPFLKYE